MSKDLKLYIRLLYYAKPYWPIAAVSISGICVAAFLEPVLPALMKPLVDKSLIERNDSSFWQVPLLLILVFLAKGIAEYVGNVASQTLALKTIADLRSAIFTHQLDLPLTYLRGEGGGRLLSRIMYDTAMVGEAVSTVWMIIIKDTLVLLGLWAFLFYTAWQLSLIVLLLAPLLSLLIRKINGRLRRSSELVQVLMGRLSGRVQESILGITEIKIYKNQNLISGRFHDINDSLRREQTRLTRVQSINVPLVQMLAASAVGLVILTASSLSRQDLLTPGEFVAFITGMSMIFEPIRRLTNVNATLQRGLAAAEAIFNLLDVKREYEQPESKSAPRPSNSSAIVQTIKNPPAIIFENIYFRHPKKEEWTIEDLSFEIKAGEIVAITGPSGSGKSTILNLLCGFGRPIKGDILIDGVSLFSLPLSVLRAGVSMVNQQTVLFDMSIADNLRMANPTATDADLCYALERASAYDFVRSMPDGINTNLDQLGTALSGGQSQRLSIARAFLKDSPLLLLDEPTSALDSGTEAAIMESLSGLMNGRTVIMSSHNKTLIEASDRVIQINKQGF